MGGVGGKMGGVFTGVVVSERDVGGGVLLTRFGGPLGNKSSSSSSLTGETDVVGGGSSALREKTTC